MAKADDADMMTQQLGFSILTAPLAAIDRRALSQAWYSALHLAQSAHAPSASSKVRPDASAGKPAQRADESHERAHAESRHASTLPRTAASKLRVALTPERRAARSVLARRIERTFLNPIVRPQRATFTIDGTRARVHVALQTTPAGVRIVAVCPASIRARVSRALDEARYALATRGIALHADLTCRP
jgi:hypothetical protein